MKRHNNFNYLATINPRHVRLPIGVFSKRSLKKAERDRSPVQVAGNIFKYSDGQEYMRMPNGAFVRVSKV